MIYHITQKAEWILARAAGEYKSESLELEGFIHCSTAQQFDQVANFYFKGYKNLVVLEINEEKLAATLKWEGDGPQKFPHVYGPIPVEAIERVADLNEREDGVFELPFKPVLH